MSILFFPPAPPRAASLRLRSTTRLVGSHPWLLQGLSGSAWVTVDDDPRDIVLAAGEQHTVPAHRRVTITALRHGAAFELTATPMAPAVPLAAPRLYRQRGSSWSARLSMPGAEVSTVTLA